MHQVGPPADIHALGAILYEIVTGRPPFLAGSGVDTLQQVRWLEPVSPRRLVPGLPRDIETICLKCLEKDPARRYESAAALADDLRRFLEDRPILARPRSRPAIGPWWLKAHPIATAVAATILLAAAVVLVAVFWQWRAAVKQVRIEARAHAIADRAARTADTARGQAEAALVDTYTTNGFQAGGQGDNARAALWFAGAARRAMSDPRAGSPAPRVRKRGDASLSGRFAQLSRR